ncbi:bactofilin family protein [Janthinobacterium agaricidamnosum]|uniref:Polymer-forming cytoskeletal family protein n=1 Tax=Janthinobacterium agaricidamnosum NBRC 102515 = DSM 9628 TaxID=1349767 RepID=W0VCV5_9BURK|nr:polymer-forming cytoskeletal protein [Janthinobacterium agaricidamnosum]CDG85208.1 conserved hypothetical protein [Janthinobacterium agaricidamnosum NBRC 102515 = DSM 9628]
MFVRTAKLPMDSLIGSATRLVGDIVFEGGLRIDGHVRGNVTGDTSQPSYLVLSEHASIEGEVRCTYLLVNGEISGPVHVSELLEIQPKARIIGEVYYKVLEMHGGARVMGQLSYLDGADAILHLAVSEA